MHFNELAEVLEEVLSSRNYLKVQIETELKEAAAKLDTEGHEMDKVVAHRTPRTLSRSRDWPLLKK